MSAGITTRFVFRYLLFTAATAAVAAVAALIVGEGLLRGFWRLRYGEGFPTARYSAAMAQVRGEPGRSDSHADTKATVTRSVRDIGEVIHPYLGFALSDGGHGAGTDWGFGPTGPNSSTRLSDDDIVVGVFGGSVARHAEDFLGPLAETIAKLPSVGGRRVRIFDLALWGGKQPQQLMALNYVLALGFRFDIVIDLDGFNEVALPPSELLPFGVHPIFPRWWPFRLASADAPELLAAVRHRERLLSLRKRFAGFVLSSPFKRSAVACRLWAFCDRRLVSDLDLARMRLDEGRLDIRRRREVSGPPFQPSDPRSPYPDLAALWARCARLTADLCRSRGIAYFLFLQPNQYVPDSKPLSAEERTKDYREDQPYRASVLAGYPLLRQDGAQLAADGVPFYDLTTIFKDDPETRYADDCCHLNWGGSRKMVARMSENIAAELTRTGWRPPRRRSGGNLVGESRNR